MATTKIYTLYFTIDSQPVVFYVGRTNDPERRLKEHRYLSSKADEMTDKYVVIRELEANGVEWDLSVIVEDTVDESDSEYEWVLLFARHNRSLGVSFINDSPLTNLKNGDLLSEMIDDDRIVTNRDIKCYRAAKKLPVSKLSIAKQYNTWSAVDQSSQIHQLLKELLRFFNLNERTLSKEIYKQTGKIPTPKAMCEIIITIDIDEHDQKHWTAQRLDQYLTLLEWADELGLI